VHLGAAFDRNCAENRWTKLTDYYLDKRLSPYEQLVKAIGIGWSSHGLVPSLCGSRLLRQRCSADADGSCGYLRPIDIRESWLCPMARSMRPATGTMPFAPGLQCMADPTATHFVRNVQRNPQKAAMCSLSTR